MCEIVVASENASDMPLTRHAHYKVYKMPFRIHVVCVIGTPSRSFCINSNSLYTTTNHILLCYSAAAKVLQRFIQFPCIEFSSDHTAAEGTLQEDQPQLAS